jgi:hypothetical protein
MRQIRQEARRRALGLLLVVVNRPAPEERSGGAIRCSTLVIGSCSLLISEMVPPFYLAANVGRISLLPPTSPSARSRPAPPASAPRHRHIRSRTGARITTARHPSRPRRFVLHVLQHSRTTPARLIMLRTSGRSPDRRSGRHHHVCAARYASKSLPSAPRRRRFPPAPQRL